MPLPEVDVDQLAARLLLIRAHLDERAWRLLLGAEAKVLGRGGIKVVAAAVKAHPDTVAQGVRELDYPDPIPGRVRRPGGGRRAAAVTDPTLWQALDALVDPVTRGDPVSALRWTTKSTVKLAGELANGGHQASASTVAKLLKVHGYSLQANSKTIEGNQPVDRDAQFGYLNDQATAFTAAADPVISVDTKKKELIGNFTAAGREWEPAGRPTATNVHDFVDKKLGKVAPYGVYDIAANTGWVNVGTDADTGQFAVESIRRWWNTMGVNTYPDAGRLLITADSGGSNGSRLRLWKTELAAALLETTDFTAPARAVISPETQVMLQLAEAARDRRAVKIGYTDREERRTDRVVHPYGIVAHNSRWYLTGLDSASNRIRSFRLDRITRVTQRDDTLDMPAVSTPPPTCSPASPAPRGGTQSRYGCAAPPMTSPVGYRPGSRQSR